ncbi:hypothetical protein GGF49_002096 [Coemansia sp. RSA 1853]|nr:hypothetical protein GGF49_002096 [Coemansia sp. RSA 1853]
MEVDQSPEEYFHQHAAAALLRSDADDVDDQKESWSEIEDASSTEDDPVVSKKKRVLRYGRNRLSEMRERFNDAKARLYEEKQQQLDLEWAQLQDGTHPQYREFIDQVDARWTDRLAKIDFKLECSNKLAQGNLGATKRSAAVTFITMRGELRQRMVHRRKRRLWALADDLRSLERVSEAIDDMAKPLSNQGAADTPVKGTAAPHDSVHLLNLPESRLPKIDEDADVSVIRGIPALLNHADADLTVPDDAAPGSHVHTGSAGAMPEALDTRVPGYAHNGYAPAYAYHGAPEDVSAAGTEYARAYGQYSATPAPAMASTAAPQQTAVQQSGGQTYYTDAPGYRYAQPGYYDSTDAQTSGATTAHTTNGHSYTPGYDGRHVYAAGHQHSSQSRAANQMRPGEAGYYDRQGAGSAQRVASKRNVGSEYDDTQSKRQRMIQQSGTWPPSTQPAHTGSEYAMQDGRVWATDPSTAMPGYSRQAYSGQQYPQGEYAYQNAYYGSTKYDYGAQGAYYQQTAYSGTGNQARPHYQGADAAYYQSGQYPQQVQQTGYQADYRANGSYSGLETGIAMGQSPGQYASRYPQQGWSEYYQQPYAQTPGTKTPQYYSRQQAEYYEQGYAAHPQQPGIAPDAASDGHYQSLTNTLK